MAEKTKRHITLVLPSSLYDRLNDMRWEQRERSFQGMVRKILGDRVEQYEAERERQAERGMAPTST
jgi:metal-responsive CopG/Arc/MetJ family transcriptional regulator